MALSENIWSGLLKRARPGTCFIHVWIHPTLKCGVMQQVLYLEVGRVDL